MDYSLKLFVVLLMMVIAAVMLYMMIRGDETSSEKHMQKIPVPIDDGRKRQMNRLPPHEEEQGDNHPFALYLGFLLFVYLLFMFLRFA